MSRLIDADELITFLEDVTITDGITFETGFKQIIADIKNQPTAFDVEKVIEELENLREVELRRPDICDELGNGDGESQYNDGVSQGRYEAFIEAIEIVKRGGRDEK